ncbi:MAG: hypothetical protein VX223_08070 [Myxococcota bacterium]|nr:hypothetical protein [Myxococcota bacterium]
MAVFGLIYLVCVWTWVQLLPGWFLSRWLIPDAEGRERAGAALLCAWAVLPLLLFLLAVAATVPMDGTFLGIFSTAINAVGLLQRSSRQALGRDWRSGAIFLALALFCGAVLAVGYRSLDGGDVFSTVHHCLYVIVMHAISNDPSVAVPLYDAASDGLVHYLVHHQTGQFNGLAPLFFEQRLGNAPILAPSVALFGTAGWWWTSATTAAAMATYAYFASRALQVSRWAALIAAGVFTLGTHNFCMYFVNENTYAVTLTSALFWGAFVKRHSIGWLALLGIIAGHLVGVRYTSVLILPAVALSAVWRPEPWSARLKRFSVGALAFGLIVAPWLYVNAIMLDSALTHPKIHAEHEGRVVTNTLLETEFEFRALNWPFIDEWSRTSWNPFPTQIWLPLQLGQSHGQLAMALALLGIVAMWRRRREFWIAVAFCLPHSLAIAWLETLDWEQLTYAAPGLVPLGVWVAYGMDTLFGDPKRQGLFLSAAVAVVLGLTAIVSGTDWPVDRRMLSRVETPERVTVTDAKDEGTARVEGWLTQIRLMPQSPVFRQSYVDNLLGALSHLPATGAEASADGPVYPSGRVAVLAGYSQFEEKSYRFVVEGSAVQTAPAQVRTSLGLHQVSLRLAAERLLVSVVRRQGQYTINVQPVGDTAIDRDFTFWLHPWMPPVKNIQLTLDGNPLPDMRTLEYGGALEMDQLRFILTNYSSEIFDVVEQPYTVVMEDDANAVPAKCGLFLFLGSGSEPSQLETLVLAGGHDTFWQGQSSGTLRIPKGLEATSLVLYVDPTCSTHVPQPGDRWAVARGPFTGEPVRLELSRFWLPH